MLMNPTFHLNRSVVLPTAALIFASLSSCALLGARVVLLDHGSHFYLVWNLFLAWLPLVFAGVAFCMEQSPRPRRWRFFAAASAWLLFFPNAPYILTDIIHVSSVSQRYYWADLVLILLFALTGLILGFLSLFLMQRIVARRYGWPTGWLFVGAVAALSGFGIYAGRFLRWNSWDLVFNPFNLITDAGQWLVNIPSRPATFILPVLFGTLLFIAYLMLYALTHLPQQLVLASNEVRVGTMSDLQKDAGNQAD